MHERISRVLIVAGSVAAMFGVALGAFGAHGLRATVSPEHLVTFETAVRYQMYHAFALIAAGLAGHSYPALSMAMLKTSGILWSSGIVLFCGSLYLLVVLNISWLGAVTPLGGLAFIAGWLTFALAAAKSR